MIALNLLCGSTASSLPMISTTTTVAEIRLKSLVSYLGTTGPVIVLFSRLSRLPWCQRSSVWMRAQTSPGLVSTRLAAVPRLTGRLAQVTILMSWTSPRAALASGNGIAFEPVGRELLFLIRMRLFFSSSSNWVISSENLVNLDWRYCFWSRLLMWT